MAAETEAVSDDVWARQEALESMAVGSAEASYYRTAQDARAKGRGSTVPSARTLLRQGMRGVIDELTALLDAPAGFGNGKRHSAAVWVKTVGVETAAFLALRGVLDMVSMNETPSLRGVALAIADTLIGEVRYQTLKAEAPGLFRYKVEHMSGTSYRHAAKTMDAAMRSAGLPLHHPELPAHQRLLVGIRLIDAVLRATGLATVERERKAGTPRLRLILCATPAFDRWVAQRDAVASVLRPRFLPMIVPPLRWEPGQDGGYLYALRSAVSLVRGYRSRLERRGLPGSTSPASPIVMQAVNAIQETAWHIHERVRDVVEIMVARGGGMAGLPLSDPEPLPAKPYSFETMSSKDPERRAWRQAAAVVYARETETRSARSRLAHTLTAADAVRNEPAIYFPHSVDFRGRIYPIPAALSPQGEDLHRGLLRFAEGKALTGTGYRALARYGAGLLGRTPDGRKVSRMRLDEREECMAALSERIVDAGHDPLANDWWLEAEKPWQFLAFCFEWADALDAQARGDVFVSTLPVSVDGTCNGLQHFAGLFHDAEMARHVNVSPADAPQDVYADIARTVVDRVRNDAASGDPQAIRWLTAHLETGIIDRKLCKKPTMTFGYGSKVYGFKEHLEAALKEHADGARVLELIADPVRQADMNVHEAAPTWYLARVLWDALGDIAPTAFQAMAWMQQVSRGIATGNRDVRWRVPGTGFEVVQRYRSVKYRQVRTLLLGNVVMPGIAEQTDKVDSREAANALAPNVIHSLDAAALALTVLCAQSRGVQHFHMVHDCYGCLAADAGIMGDACREVFATLYADAEMAESLEAQWREQWPTESKLAFPAAPLQGALDASTVIASRYFFA